MSSARLSAIWGFAFGYFACYVPYSALTKSLSNGRLMGGASAVSGFELLPATVIATSVTFLLYIALSGAWRDLRRVAIWGLALPLPRWQTLVSGTAAAAIIASTTLNYTFEGISLLFALLLMRGGVLVLAPVVDRVSGRSVHWYSWLAFGLSLLAVAIALADVGNYVLTSVAIINLCAYFLGYVFRLNFMSRVAKKPSATENRLFFMEETSVYAGLVFFGLLYAPVELVLSLALNHWSRRHEFEADRFAAETVDEPLAMASALQKLAADNLQNLTPHPFYVVLHHSHPPVAQRVAAIRWAV